MISTYYMEPNMHISKMHACIHLSVCLYVCVSVDLRTYICTYMHMQSCFQALVYVFECNVHMHVGMLVRMDAWMHAAWTHGHMVAWMCEAWMIVMRRCMKHV